MEKLIIDLWPFLTTALFGAIAWLWKKIISMSERLVVMETNMNTCKVNMNEDIQALKEKINIERDQIHKLIDTIQRRQDSHSKKQDEIMNMLGDIKLEIVKEIGNMTTEMGVISAEVKSINRVLSINDEGIKFKKKD